MKFQSVVIINYHPIGLHFTSNKAPDIVYVLRLQDFWGLHKYHVLVIIHIKCVVIVLFTGHSQINKIL